MLRKSFIEAAGAPKMSSAQIQPIIIYRKIWNAQKTSQYIAKPHVAPDCPTPFYGWSEEEKVTQSLQAETICATRPQKSEKHCKKFERQYKNLEK